MESASSPGGYAEWEEIIAAVTNALTHLPEAYREVVTLYDLRGLPADELHASRAVTIVFESVWGSRESF